MTTAVPLLLTETGSSVEAASRWRRVAPDDTAGVLPTKQAAGCELENGRGDLNWKAEGLGADALQLKDVRDSWFVCNIPARWLLGEPLCATRLPFFRSVSKLCIGHERVGHSCHPRRSLRNHVKFQFLHWIDVACFPNVVRGIPLLAYCHCYQVHWQASCSPGWL